MTWSRRLVALIFCLSLTAPAWAHLGPPIQIVQSKSAGPFVVSVWTHPDLGTGTFFVIVDPAPGRTVPKDLTVQIAVQPESGRLPEAINGTERDSVEDQVQFDGEAKFDKQEFWRVRVILQSSMWSGDVLARVEPTPTTLGQLHVILWSFPFFFFGFLWFRGMSQRRKRMRKRKAGRAPAAAVGSHASLTPRSE